jgi:cysteinyl-tRNA synthetase
MQLFNTLSRALEELKPITPGKVGIYSCGPTVYDYAHIGHIRTYIFVDILKRVLRYLDYNLTHVMNITDVGHLTSDADTGEDKMEKGARRESKSVWDIARFYTDYFFNTMDKVNVGRPDIICKATDNIKEMIDLVKKLEEKGFTYKTSDGIYFDTSKFPEYGKLAKLDIKGLKEGARVEKNPEKRNATDFALWKFSPSGVKRQMEWDSPWGVGFPGWHLECSAMSMKYLGPTFDIHTGGIDHIPVHHPNEIAQSEAATGKKFVNYWLHAGHLLVEGEKMSKSLGNFWRLEDVIKKGFQPLALRYLFLTAHYRSTMNFEWRALEGASKALEKLNQHLTVYQRNSKRTELSAEKMVKIEEFQKKFFQAVTSDLDIPTALSLSWEVIKSNIPDYDKYDLLLEWDQILGLGLGQAKTEEVVISPEIKSLIDRRELLRKQRKWSEADQVRKEIEEKGYILEDTSKGAKIKKKESFM